MKTSLLMITITVLGLSSPAMSQETAKQDQGKTSVEIKKNGPVAEFDKTVFDFGDIVQSNPGTAVFTLTNKGNEPLLVSSATASCGCTNLNYSKEPILPGKSTTISVTYNAAAIGTFIKSVTVKSNASDQAVILQIKGKVVPKS